jgi:Protein of unknown function (DUF3151)
MNADAAGLRGSGHEPAIMRGMSDQPIQFSPGGLPETVLPLAPAEARDGLTKALALDGDARREAIAAVVARFPRFLDGWARLGEYARDDVEAYAAFRVGYHRGLDALRGAGWRGSGYVRSVHPENLGFLRALDGLRRQAGRIGEADEEARCAEFLHQLDPNWPES